MTHITIRHPEHHVVEEVTLDSPASSDANKQAINQALDAAGQIGAKVLLPGGTIYVAGELGVWDRSGIEGHGAFDTTLVLPDAANTARCVIGPRKWLDDHASPGFPVTIRNLQIDATDTTAGTPGTWKSLPAVAN